MREVERSRFVMARPPAVHRTLSPEAVVAAEGWDTAEKAEGGSAAAERADTAAVAADSSR